MNSCSQWVCDLFDSLQTTHARADARPHIIYCLGYSGVLSGVLQTANATIADATGILASLG